MEGQFRSLGWSRRRPRRFVATKLRNSGERGDCRRGYPKEEHRRRDLGLRLAPLVLLTRVASRNALDPQSALHSVPAWKRFLLSKKRTAPFLSSKELSRISSAITEPGRRKSASSSSRRLDRVPSTPT